MITIENNKNDFSMAENIKSSTGHPVSAMCASEDVLVVANDEGDISCYDPNRDFYQKFYIAGAGHPCTCLAQINDTVFAGAHRSLV